MAHKGEQEELWQLCGPRVGNHTAAVLGAFSGREISGPLSEAVQHDGLGDRPLWKFTLAVWLSTPLRCV